MGKVLIGNFKGPKGDRGEPGADGAAGPQGIQGVKGDPATINGHEAVTLTGGDNVTVEDDGEGNITLGVDVGVTSVNGGTGDVEIGGLNLLNGTTDPRVIAYGGTSISKTTNVAVTEWDAIDAIQYTGTSGTQKLAFYFTSYGREQKLRFTNKKYCMSAYIKNNGDDPIQFGRNSSDSKIGGVVTINPGDSKRFSVTCGTGTVGDLIIQVHFVMQPGTKFDVTIWHLKVEYGTIPTDWSPAPEDKQDTLTGTQGQVVGFDAAGKAVAAEVGGRNILRGTAELSIGVGTYDTSSFRTTGGPDVLLSTIDISSEQNVPFNRGIRVAPGPGHNTFSGFAQDGVPIVIGEMYTISVYARGTGSFFAFIDKCAGQVQKLKVNSNWQLFHFKNTVGGTQIREKRSVYFQADINQGDTVEFCGPKLERGTVATDWSPAPEDLAPMSEVNILLKMQDRIYEGMDLTQKFANEIKESPYNGDPWAWIAARIKAREFDGIHVKDHIPFIANGNTFHAEVAGICTYEGYGDTPVGPHIDFICRELWPVNHPMNLVNYNNGISTQEFPWLASDGYHWLNSLKGSVPNGTTVNPELKEVDYTEDGVWYYLPEELKKVIVEKFLYLNRRYSNSGLLTADNGFALKSLGKLWLPTEAEVYGCGVANNSSSSILGSALQYPIFSGNMVRKKNGIDGIRHSWCLIGPCGTNSIGWCYVGASGYADNYEASATARYMPVCFRIA